MSKENNPDAFRLLVIDDRHLLVVAGTCACTVEINPDPEPGASKYVVLTKMRSDTFPYFFQSLKEMIPEEVGLVSVVQEVASDQMFMVPSGRVIGVKRMHTLGHVWHLYPAGTHVSRALVQRGTYMQEGGRVASAVIKEGGGDPYANRSTFTIVNGQPIYYNA